MTILQYMDANPFVTCVLAICLASTISSVAVAIGIGRGNRNEQR